MDFYIKNLLVIIACLVICVVCYSQKYRAGTIFFGMIAVIHTLYTIL